jgi:hypothetical protein
MNGTGVGVTTGIGIDIGIFILLSCQLEQHCLAALIFFNLSFYKRF